MLHNLYFTTSELLLVPFLIHIEKSHLFRLLDIQYPPLLLAPLLNVVLNTNPARFFEKSNICFDCIYSVGLKKNICF